MAQAAAIMAFGTLIFTGLSYSMQKDAAEQAEDIGKMNAARILRESEEQASRLAEQTERESKLIKAIQAAGGAGGVSPQVYVLDFETTRQREIQWIKESGYERADIAKAGGAAAGATGMAGAYSTLFQGLGQSGSWFLESYDRW